jgi:hypothetical protein
MFANASNLLHFSTLDGAVSRTRLLRHPPEREGVYGIAVAVNTKLEWIDLGIRDNPRLLSLNFLSNVRVKEPLINS